MDPSRIAGATGPRSRKNREAAGRAATAHSMTVFETRATAANKNSSGCPPVNRRKNDEISSERQKLSARNEANLLKSVLPAIVDNNH
jgi:hypothetical protein